MRKLHWSTLEKAFQSLRLNSELSEREEKSLIQLTDKFTTCTLNAEMAKQHIDEDAHESEGRKIVANARDCQIHHHTQTCSKRGGKCRFNYPKLPMWKTVLAYGVKGDTLEDRDNLTKRHEKIIKVVREVLGNSEVINDILSNYNLDNESLEEYQKNRKERILLVLAYAEVTEEQYIAAVTESSKRGISIVLQWDITECMVNNYNGEWLRAWSGNMDIQMCDNIYY